VINVGDNGEVSTGDEGAEEGSEEISVEIHESSFL
jgi:hypothetical protein